MLKDKLHKYCRTTAIAFVFLAGLTHFAESQINLNQKQLDAVNEIQTYLNGITTMEGGFVQIGPYGGQSEGKFYIDRPGKIRFNYNPPSSLQITSDGSSVAVVDTKIRNQDLWPLGQTPLRYLLSDSIDIAEETNILAVEFRENLIVLVIEEDALIGTHKLAIFYDSNAKELRQWTVTDAQGLNTIVSLFNVEKGLPADPKNFEIDYAYDRFERGYD